MARNNRRPSAGPIRWALIAAAALCLGGAFGEGESLLRNGGFDRDTAGWSFWFSPGQAVGKAVWVPRDGGGALQVEIERAGGASSVQIYQGPFPVRKGGRYSISFEARAEKPGSLRVQLMRNDPPYSSLGLTAQVPLTTAWLRYTLAATATNDADNARLDFFPAAGFQLDSVAVQPAPGDPPALKPAVVSLGPGWQGDAGALLDDNPATTVRAGGNPRLPLFVVADLGRPTGLQQVIVAGQDQNRYFHLDGMDVEVSEDGAQWHAWARGAKDATGEPTRPRATAFSASSLAVRARFLRLRVTRVTGGAILTGLSVGAAEGEGVAPALFPVVAPVTDLSFLGWDYERLGYAASPGETIAVQWANQGSRSIDVPVEWRLSRYYGPEIARGAGRLRIEPAARAALSVPLPAQLPGGPMLLRCEFPGQPEAEAQLFQFDSLPPSSRDKPLRVVAILDNQDAEGWMRMIAGPAAPHLNPTADWPSAGPPPDAALVCAEAWTADDPHVVRLREYLEAGGRALVFGVPAPGIEPLIPVTVARDALNPEKPLRLGRLSADAALWADFRAENGPPHYALRAVARPGATVLASWEDGTHAVVEGPLGRGRVVYVGTGSGQVWQRRPELAGADELALRLLYRLAGRTGDFVPLLAEARRALAAEEAARRQTALQVLGAAKLPAGFTVTSRANVGRFGWRMGEGGLVENLGEDGRITCPAEANAWFIAVEGAGALTPRPAGQNWLVKRIAWHDEHGEALRSTFSLASPGILWEGTARELTVISPATTHVAYWTAAGAKVVPAGDAPIPVGEMAANWLLLFSATDGVRDTPRLVVLTRRPTAIQVKDGVRLRFGGSGFGALWTAHLWGIRRLAPGATRSWTAGLPEDAVRAATRWGRAFLSTPVECDEVAWMEGDTAVVANRFQFRTFRDDWNTRPLALSPLPPVLSLAHRDGVPVAMPAGVLDCEMATKYGPLEAVEGDAVRYRIPLPPHDHFGVIPVAGLRELDGAIDHYALDGTGSVTTASGGLVTSSPFLEDLRRYMASGTFPPFAAPCIDLYKWWYCFPTVAGRPSYGPEARERVDAYHRDHYRRTLNFYGHKSFIRFRREPFTGLDYTVSFIWPVQFERGVRYFTDQNESSAVLAYCLDTYARYYGDWPTLRANWNLCRRLYEYLPRFQDWAWMTSSNQAYFSVAGIDMLNSEYPGSLAFARAARQVGDLEAETTARVLAAKSLVPAVARFAMPDYVRSITAEGDPWREGRYYFSFSETGLQGDRDIDMRGGPESILELAIGFLDTSKGTSPEIALAYKAWVPRRIEVYERELAAEEQRRSHPAGWPHLMQRALLGWPRAEMIAAAERYHAHRPRFGWQSTKAPHNLAVVAGADTPLFLAEWDPAEYLSGSYDPERGEVALRFRNRESGTARVRLYSRRAPTRVAVAGREWAAGPERWSYDARTGWLTLLLPGEGEHAVAITLGEPAAPPHPYFAPIGGATRASQP